MASIKITRELYRELTGGRDWLNDDIRVGLLKAQTTSPFATTAKAYEFVDDIVADEADDPSYTGRIVVAGKTVTVDDVNHWVVIDCDPLIWAGLDVQGILGAFTYHHVGIDDSLNPLMYIFDHQDIVPTGAGLQLNPNSGGLLRFRQG